MDLRYGLNTHQPAQAVAVCPDRWPVRLVHGRPSYINLLDALTGWQLAREASRAFGQPVAASFSTSLLPAQPWLDPSTRQRPDSTVSRA